MGLKSFSFTIHSAGEVAYFSHSKASNRNNMGLKSKATEAARGGSGIKASE